MEQKKAMTPNSAEELERIYKQMRPGTLLVPIRQEATPGASVGPRFAVFRLHSELALEPNDPEAAYWDALEQANVIDGIGEMSWINGNLSEARATDQQIHRDLATRFVEPAVLAQIANRELEGAASVVFNRIGCLLTIRHLMLFGGTNPRDWGAYKVGRLALLANDFVQDTPNPPTGNHSNLDLMLLMAPTWDVYNSRNLGHAMSRIFTILTEILPGSDPAVTTLVSQLGITANKIEIDGIPLYQFFALVFGIFAYARSPEAQTRVLFNVDEIFTQTDMPQKLLEKFLEARARTLDEFRNIFTKGTVVSQATFADELKQRPFLIDSLNLFRKYPFLRLDSERVLILDVQFVAELLTSGVYWNMHDGLPREKGRHSSNSGAGCLNFTS